MNGDLLPDIVVARFPGGMGSGNLQGLLLAENLGAREFATAANLRVGYAEGDSLFAGADVIGTGGEPDVVFAISSNPSGPVGRVYVVPGGADGPELANRIQVSPDDVVYESPQEVIVADFNGDGPPLDILVTDAASNGRLDIILVRSDVMDRIPVRCPPQSMFSVCVRCAFRPLLAFEGYETLDIC